MAVKSTRGEDKKTENHKGTGTDRGRFDDIKHILRKFEGILEVVILTYAYYVLWSIFYRTPESPFRGNGKFVLTGLYALLILIIFYLCDSFKFGHLRMLDIVISQGIAMVLVNSITYLQLCLIANKVVSPLYMLLLTVYDFLQSFVLVYIFNKVYRINNIPRKMLLVYGQNNALDIKFKLDTRLDKYKVSKIISINKGIDAVCRQIDSFDGVIINDVPAQIRNDLLKYCYQNSVRAYIVPKISDIITRGADEINLFDTPLLMVKGGGLSVFQRAVKRTMDVLLCVIALIPLSPFMGIIALCIKLEDKGPVFYKQRRVTKDGREFDILKFRSMIVDAEKEGHSIPATGRDPRITKIGRFIRATRMDELGQLLNIIKGDMSIVGPRPERVEHVEKYSAMIPEFCYRHKVKGGLTGYAQIFGKYNTSPYDKLRLDLMYIENYSLFLDIKLIFMTLRILLKPESTEGFDKAEELKKMTEQLILESEENGEQADNAPAEKDQELGAGDKLTV